MKIKEVDKDKVNDGDDADNDTHEYVSDDAIYRKTTRLQTV